VNIEIVAGQYTKSRCYLLLAVVW